MGSEISGHKSFGGLPWKKRRMCRIQRRIARDVYGQWRGAGTTSSAPFNTTWSLDLSNQITAPCRVPPPRLPVRGKKKKCRRYLLVSKRIWKKKRNLHLLLLFFVRVNERDRGLSYTVNRVARCRNKWPKVRDESCCWLPANTHSETRLWRAASLVRETFH